VRSAQVARGQAEVALLRARTLVSVEKLRLFEQMGVASPVDVANVRLTDTFTVQEPTWQLSELLTMAEQQNPALKALRAREGAAAWNKRAVASAYGPSLSVSAGWSGFTQQFTDVDPIIFNGQQASAAQLQECQDNNVIRQNSGLPPNSCAGFVWGAGDEQRIRDANSVFPFEFTQQPFQARLTVSLPVFTNFGQQLRVSEARAQLNDAEEQVRARGLAVQTDVSQAFLTLQTAFRAVGLQDTNRTAGREQLQLATERYRVGSGTFFDLLNPYALVGGLTTLTLFVLHGAVFLALKTDGEMRQRAGALAARLAPAAIVVAAVFLAWTAIAHRDAVGLALFVAAAFCLGGAAVATRLRREGWAFLATGATLVLAVFGLFVTLFPDVMPSTIAAANSLTVHNASSTPYTLKVMTWVAVFFTPLVLLYQGWTYWVFRKRLTSKTMVEY